MQISSTNAGFVSAPGSSVAPQPARKQAAGSSADTQALQEIALPVVPGNTSIHIVNNADTSRARVLAPQYTGSIENLSGNAQTGRLRSDAAAQRAVMEYNNVAMQEQRSELTGMLVGIDVFA